MFDGQEPFEAVGQTSPNTDGPSTSPASSCPMTDGSPIAACPAERVGERKQHQQLHPKHQELVLFDRDEHESAEGEVGHQRHVVGWLLAFARVAVNQRELGRVGER